MAQLSKVLKVVCWAGSVPFPPVSLQRQVVCLKKKKRKKRRIKKKKKEESLSWFFKTI